MIIDYKSATVFDAINSLLHYDNTQVIAHSIANMMIHTWLMRISGECSIDGSYDRSPGDSCDDVANYQNDRSSHRSHGDSYMTHVMTWQTLKKSLK